MGRPPIIASIIIPMRNECRYIGKCLDSILANDFPRDQYEILVVDGMSMDNSRAIVLAKAAQFPWIRLLDNPEKIVPTAMNLAIREARGKYIIRMDAHSEYPPTYVRTCIEELERTGADNVGGRWIIKPGADSVIAKAIAFLGQHPFGVGDAAYRIGLGDRYVDTVPFGTYRKELFHRIGFYREDLVRHQDFELNARIRRAGGKIFLSSKIEVVYYSVPTLSAFLQQAYMNGSWVGRTWLRYPGSFCWRHGAPLAWVSGVLGCLVLGWFLPSFWMAATIILILYSLLVLGASMQIAFRHGLAFLFVLPGLFFSHHFTYGLATLGSLLCFPFARKAEMTNVSTLSDA